ncbi:intron binding protein aquarius [Trichuris trichiura]|uniref:Intron binding protein aquarius n=1 Tax=Trichuris trichiura TaxID=36087 RepID=A0A077Z2T1_TRITR|nr:intron binding protein aquarius [Trichuris trichiura]
MPEKKGRSIPTVQQLVEDKLIKVASQYWAPFTSEHAGFKPEVVADIYCNELLRKGFAPRQIMLLEFSQYLERFLWPNYEADTSSVEHLLSILVMVNEKFRDRTPVWQIFASRPDQFARMFKKVMNVALDHATLTLPEKTIVIVFLGHCFNSVVSPVEKNSIPYKEIDSVRALIQKLVSLPSWVSLPTEIRNALLSKNAKLKKVWRAVEKHDSKMSEDERKDAYYHRTFLFRLLKTFVSVLNSIPSEGRCDLAAVRYCERFLEFLIDLNSLLPIRRFFNAILQANHIVTSCYLSNLFKREEGKLFRQLSEMLKFYCRFEIDDLTGEALTTKQMMDLHMQKVANLQRVNNCFWVLSYHPLAAWFFFVSLFNFSGKFPTADNVAFSHFRDELKEFYLRNISCVDSRESIVKYFSSLDAKQLIHLLQMLHLIEADWPKQKMSVVEEKAFYLEVLVTNHEKYPSQLESINNMPLYPTEEIIWDENVVPDEYYGGDECLALNKLGLQFLTMYDYLLRNFNLFRLESTYQIRKDIEDALFRLKPWKHETDESLVVFGGWARMALPITNFSVVEVGKPNVGENCPSIVRADVQLTLNLRPDIRSEWLNLRKHDVCFLVTVRPSAPVGTKYDVRQAFKDQIPVVHVRGCEIEGMLGPDGKLIEEYGGGSDSSVSFSTNIRTFRVWLDSNQYRDDLQKQTASGGEDVYGTFNVIIRRKPKENNFKAVLDTIRQLMNSSCVVPDWLHDVLLGYGDPTAAHYSKMSKQQATLDFDDTFVSFDHVKDSFVDYKCVLECSDGQDPVPPFKLDITEGPPKQVTVIPYSVSPRGPYPTSRRKFNSVRFTPAQVEAIRSGMQPGLTLIVGPPGTGKTDVAAQIINNLYHNWPEQRTLVVTHSNQALNHLFEKIMALDIDERHLLRHGEEELATEKDFSKYGRVNYVLSQRLRLLKEVERLQHSLDVPGDVAYTCETARYFFVYQVTSRWADFLTKLSRSDRTADTVASLFPFTRFFENLPPEQPLFKGNSYEEDMEMAEACWRYIRNVFDELDEFRSFELLRGGRDRVEYLVIREAKVIAMTCTHAALRRKELVQIAFHYDNVLMEEAAQILEIETFIPLLLQETKDGHNRLKRWILIGDHHQLPPVIKNQAFQKYSNMEQSLFARLVRLGVPRVNLDMQGRARPSLAALYSWRYPRLDNLPHIVQRVEYQLANPGFLYEYQLIDVGDYNGVGESAPTPHFYQNLAEAEYAVAIFMYMRMLGYPAERISILTTYNGQKHLIKDIVRRRCGNNPLLGSPAKITTVDKYQGQQNDYIILSLVRSQAVGHIRDLRRLVVAMSRAKLGLYILARVSLFRNCFELTPHGIVFYRSFDPAGGKWNNRSFQLCQRPQNLILVPTEVFASQLLRKANEISGVASTVEIQSMPDMVSFVYEYYTANAETLRQEWAAANEGIVEPVAEVNKEADQLKETEIEFEVLNE